MKIILESTLETISTRVDGTLKLTLSTQEIDSSKAGELFQLRGKFCKFLLSDSNITKLEEELVDSTALVGGKKQKTASQRLRAVLFRLNESNGGNEETFEQFYKSELERIIEHYKAKLD